MYTIISKEVTGTIARAIWQNSDEWFGDSTIFAPIVVIRSRDPGVLNLFWKLALDRYMRPHL